MALPLLLGCSGDSPGGMTDGSSSTSSTSTTTGTPTTGEPTSSGTTTTEPTTTGTTTSPTTTSTSDDTTTTTTTGVDSTTTTTTTVGETTSTSGMPMPVCGDGVVDDGEACDGDDVGEETCVSQGFDGGELGCLDTCEFDTTSCAACGDGELDAGEACDDGNVDPGDGCDAACEVEACDPDGLYAIQGPAVAYTCCNGLVSVNINAFTLSSDGASIASSPSNPVAMTGAATTCPDGEFTNQGALQGGCTETYAVSGSFVDKDTWSGTYTLTFTGNQCSCFNGMLGAPCVDQMFPITAKR